MHCGCAYSILSSVHELFPATYCQVSCCVLACRMSVGDFQMYANGIAVVELINSGETLANLLHNSPYLVTSL